MVWENRNRLLQNDAWQDQYRKAKAFYDEFGHLNVTNDYDGGNGKAIALWLSRQRSLKFSGKLSKEQISSLEKINMAWMTSAEREWEKHYESAKQYFHKNGTLNIPCTYVDENGFPLGMWLWRIRSNKVKLKTSGANGNQLERLKNIGMEFCEIS